MVQFEFVFSHAAKDSRRKLFSASIPQLHKNPSVYQNVWMTGYSDWYVIVNVAYNMLII